MGYGSYDYEAHVQVASKRKGRSQAEVFSQRSCHPTMKPHGVRFREARDSAEHPDSVPVIFALDVSGSMGEIPAEMASKTMPTFMRSVLTVLPDPQLMFMGIGHPDSDQAPLQVGQFESDDALMDQWLTRMYLEGGGGGGNETYELAMYFAARHTATDAWEKRGRKGYLFITGDEPTNQAVLARHVQAVMGEDLSEDIPLADMVAEVSQRYHTFFLIPDQARARQVGDDWRGVLGDHVIGLHSPDDTAVASALLIGFTEGQISDMDAAARKLEDELNWTGSARNRVLDAVATYAASLGALGMAGGPGKAEPPHGDDSGNDRV